MLCLRQMVKRAVQDHAELVAQVCQGAGNRKKAVGAGRKIICPEIGQALFGYVVVILLQFIAYNCLLL